MKEKKKSNEELLEKIILKLDQQTELLKKIKQESYFMADLNLVFAHLQIASGEYKEKILNQFLKSFPLSLKD